MKKVLVVEDDKHIVELLTIHLKDLDCEVDVVFDGKEGLLKILNESYHLIILDLMLPSMDGMEICRRARARNIHTPVMMLTAKSEEIDKVLGLEMGADDYMTKPFSIREFIARVKAIFRRTSIIKENLEQEGQNALLKRGNLIIDLDKRKVTLNDKRIELSPKEFELLSLLASKPGKSYDRCKLLNLVWGYDFDGFEHTVNSHINRLRGKIEPNIQNPTYILTTWGVGYRFSEEV
jgi:two-component system, OmpR family, alkaline phosphatase synthesis response regulator PhoP